jgi:DNA helicase HerA-like ATPase
MPVERSIIGKVASPPRRESTSEEFFFWIAPGQLIEKTQIICSSCRIGDTDVQFYGIITEVFRQSRQTDMAEEIDRYDGDITYQPPFESAGFTFASVRILRTVPPVLCPPVEGSNVVLGGAAEAQMAYGADEIENKLAIGVVKNGGTRLAGPGFIDTDYLLGANGGHLNVNGVAGRGTKSSFLLHVNHLLLREAARQKAERPSDPNRLRIVPIILNVKNFDLFHIDRWSTRYDAAKHQTDWTELGIDAPKPFQRATFLAPQIKNSKNAIDTGRTRNDVQGYSWSLSDIIERGLLTYLFAEEDVFDSNFGALVHDVESRLTEERTVGEETRRTLSANGRPRNFDELLNEVGQMCDGEFPQGISSKHHVGTIRKLHRRLFKMVSEGSGVLRRNELKGCPLELTAKDTRDPAVVDLNGLIRVPSLQRFVVAAILKQLEDDRTGSTAQQGLVYIVTLDELNRFAPKGSRDAITQLIERIAAEMRSQGIILLGAQQQASMVSQRVIENAGLRVLGKTGSLELDQPVWSFLSKSAKSKAVTLLPEEKMLIQDSFREPMLVKIPMPPWALRKAEAGDFVGETASAATKPIPKERI